MRKSKNPIRICEICGQEKKIYAKGRCLSCYNKMRHYGVDTAEELKEKLANNRRGLAEMKRARTTPKPPSLTANGKKRGRKPSMDKATTPCKICGEIGVLSSGMCGRCYRISSTIKSQEPKEILAMRQRSPSMRNRKYAKDAKCVICGKEGIYARGLCKNCYCAVKHAGVNSENEFKDFFTQLEQAPDSIPLILKRKNFEL